MNALLINSKDNVAIVTCPVDQGMKVRFFLNRNETQLIASTAIPKYHKIAIGNMQAGEKIIKYGHIIGEATKDIQAGEHVHCHNAASTAKKEPG